MLYLNKYNVFAGKSLTIFQKTYITVLGLTFFVTETCDWIEFIFYYKTQILLLPLTAHA